MIFNQNSKDSQQTANALGVWIAPGLGKAWNGELKRILRDLHTQRVSMFNFVPSGWAKAVDDLQLAYPDDLVRLSPATFQNGSLITTNPDWLQSQSVAAPWQEAFNSENKAIGKYAQQQQEDGKAELDALYSKANFWNTAYETVKGIADAPSNAFNAVYDRLDGKIKLLLIGALLVGALFVVGPYVLPFLKSKK